LLPLIAILAASGLVAGFAAGMLGVGGGIVTVPVLEYSLRFAGVPEEWRMHVAVATSLAAIIPTSISSARMHHSRAALDWQLARRWSAPIVAGAIAGSVLASHAPLSVLAGIFGSVALLIALKMLLPLDHLRDPQALDNIGSDSQHVHVVRRRFAKNYSDRLAILARSAGMISRGTNRASISSSASGVICLRSELET
jgi:uncharacterized membrane protein YfcA